MRSTQQTPPREGIPFVPSPSAVNEALVRSFVRAAAALINNKGNTVKAAKQVEDPGALRILNRTAVTPTSTSATAFKQTTIAYFASILQGTTAIGAIIAGSTQLELARAGALWCPGIGADATGVGFISEAAAFPVLQWDLSAGATVSLQKLGFAVPVTDELLMHSNTETVLRALIAAKLRAGGESLMLDDIEGDSTRPPGLRFNVGAETASSTATVEGMVADLSLIVSKVAAVAGLTDTIIVASPQQAVKIWAQLPMFRIPVFASAALDDGVMMAIACSGIAICGSTEAPRIELSNKGVFHMDTDPSQITADSPEAAFPVVGLYQAGLQSLRVICEITWKPRAATGVVSWVQNVAW